MKGGSNKNSCFKCLQPLGCPLNPVLLRCNNVATQYMRIAAGCQQLFLKNSEQFDLGQLVVPLILLLGGGSVTTLTSFEELILKIAP
jgi:hypothetical protein